MILQKYQVLGNDFLIFDCINFEQNAEFLQSEDFLNFVVEKSDRRRLGCDQFIVMEKSTKAKAKIMFYNSDGSKAEACGNGTVASGVYASTGNRLKPCKFSS
jgi:diaminopimelate epimerase